jgi:hypothetical protein
MVQTTGVSGVARMAGGDGLYIKHKNVIKLIGQ